MIIWDTAMGVGGCGRPKKTQKPPGTVLFWLVPECVAIQIRPKRSQVLKP